MDSKLSMQKPNQFRRRREVLEHFSSRSKIQHHSLGFVKKLAKSWIGIMGDNNFTVQIRNKWSGRRAVRRVIEGTSSEFIGLVWMSGLQERWCRINGVSWTWYCDRRFMKLRCIYGARCFSVTYDGGKSLGRYIKITRLFCLIKRCREHTHTSRNERRTRTSSSFGTRLSEDFDQITECKKTSELDLNWRFSGSTLAQSLRSTIWLNRYGRGGLKKLWLKKEGRKSPDEGACAFGLLTT